MLNLLDSCVTTSSRYAVKSAAIAQATDKADMAVQSVMSLLYCCVGIPPSFAIRLTAKALPVLGQCRKLAMGKYESSLCLCQALGYFNWCEFRSVRC